MAQQQQILAELKLLLRERGWTYADVAPRLGLSEASIKRLFSRGGFTLERLDALCEQLGLKMSDLFERLAQRERPASCLTHAQELEIVSDPKLFLVTYFVLNRWSAAEILARFKLTGQELERYLIRLDRLKLIELQPGNRTRLKVTATVAWRPGGPVQRYVRRRLLSEFFASDFAQPQAEFTMYGVILSDGALARVKRVLQNTLRDCQDISTQDAAMPLDARNGAAIVLALRPWSYSGFDELRREPPARSQRPGA
jgi:DNA-binding Xre family transcriptional regulator